MQTPTAKQDVTEVIQDSVAPRARSWYKHLSVQILLAMILGVMVGHVWPERADALKPLGDLFIKLVRMLVAPIIFCTVVHGIASVGEAKKVGRVAIKSLIYFEVVTTIALILALLLVNLWAPGAGMHVDLKAVADIGVKAPAKPVNFGQFLLNLVPASDSLDYAGIVQNDWLCNVRRSCRCVRGYRIYGRQIRPALSPGSGKTSLGVLCMLPAICRDGADPDRLRRRRKYPAINSLFRG